MPVGAELPPFDLATLPSFAPASRPYEIEAFYDRALDHFGGGRFVEVGVYFGRTAIYLARESIRRGLRIEVHAVDTFKGRAADECDHLYRTAIDDVGGETLSGFLQAISAAGVAGTIRPRPGISWLAAEQFEDDSLDLAFLDAGHSSGDCRRDIAAFWPKVRPGGWLAGHDFDWRFPGVVRAVGQFATAQRLNCRMENSVWWIEKPEANIPCESP